jgi:sulfur-oxidizing protein SoxY
MALLIVSRCAHRPGRVSPPSGTTLDQRRVSSSDRRTLLKGTVAVGVIAAAADAGLIRPTHALAADWPRNAFAAETVAGALTALFGRAADTPSNAIMVKAPRRAPTGGRISVSVSTSLPNVDSIAIVIDKNPLPFSSRLRLSGAEPFISADVRMRGCAKPRKCGVLSAQTANFMSKDNSSGSP